MSRHPEIDLSRIKPQPVARVEVGLVNRTLDARA